MTMASAPRGTGPPVAIDVAVPDSTGRIGAVPQAMISSLSISADRRRFAGRGEIGGTHRKAVDIGAVERRHVDRRHDVLRQRAAERVGKRPLLARHARAETTRPRNAPAHPRATGWSGTGPDRTPSRSSGRASIGHAGTHSFPQHIGIDRRARSKTFGAAGHHEPGIGAGDRVERQIARPPAASRRPRFHSSRTISAMPTVEAILRASGR